VGGLVRLKPNADGHYTLYFAVGMDWVSQVGRVHRVGRVRQVGSGTSGRLKRGWRSNSRSSNIEKPR